MEGTSLFFCREFGTGHFEDTVAHIENGLVAVERSGLYHASGDGHLFGFEFDRVRVTLEGTSLNFFRNSPELLTAAHTAHRTHPLGPTRPPLGRNLFHDMSTGGR